MMNKNDDKKLTYAEFVDGSKQDPAIAKVYPPPSAVCSHGRALTLQLQVLSPYGGPIFIPG